MTLGEIVRIIAPIPSTSLTDISPTLVLPTIHVDFDIPFRGAIKTLFVPSDRSLTGFLGELGSLWGSSNITFAYRVSTTEKKTKKSNAIPFRLVQNSKDWENLWNEIRRATDEAKKKDERARTTAIKANKPRPTPTRVHVEVEDRTEKEDFGEVEVRCCVRVRPEVLCTDSDLKNHRRSRHPDLLRWQGSRREKRAQNQELVKLHREGQPRRMGYHHARGRTGRRT